METFRLWSGNPPAAQARPTKEQNIKSLRFLRHYCTAKGKREGGENRSFPRRSVAARILFRSTYVDNIRRGKKSIHCDSDHTPRFVPRKESLDSLLL